MDQFDDDGYGFVLFHGPCQLGFEEKLAAPEKKRLFVFRSVMGFFRGGKTRRRRTLGFSGSFGPLV